MIEIDLFSMIIGVVIGELVRSYIGQKIRNRGNKKAKKIIEKNNKLVENGSKIES